MGKKTPTADRRIDPIIARHDDGIVIGHERLVSRPPRLGEGVEIFAASTRPLTAPKGDSCVRKIR